MVARYVTDITNIVIIRLWLVNLADSLPLGPR